MNLRETNILLACVRKKTQKQNEANLCVLVRDIITSVNTDNHCSWPFVPVLWLHGVEPDEMIKRNKHRGTGTKQSNYTFEINTLPEELHASG